MHGLRDVATCGDGCANPLAGRDFARVIDGSERRSFQCTAENGGVSIRSAISRCSGRPDLDRAVDRLDLSRSLYCILHLLAECSHLGGGQHAGRCLWSTHRDVPRFLCPGWGVGDTSRDNLGDRRTARQTRTSFQQVTCPSRRVAVSMPDTRWAITTMSTVQQQVVFAAIASPVCIAVGVLGFWAVQRAIRFGRIGGTGQEIQRDEYPRVFWTCVWMWRVMAVIWIVAGIAIALSPLVLCPAEH